MFGSDHEDAGGKIFQDLMTMLFLAFVFGLAIILPHINPLAQKAKEDATKPPGVVSVEAIWPSDSLADVDLWVQGPGDIPVGYSNKSGGLFSLLRDDLGKMMDISNLNMENAYTRGFLPGEYVVNLHLYRNIGSVPNIPVQVIVSSRKGDGPMNQILESKVTLPKEGKEITVFRFRLDANGALVPGSVNDLFKPLRNGSK